MESIRTCRRAARVAPTALEQTVGGCICGAVPSVGTSDVVIVRPVNMRRSISMPRGIRLQPASNRGRVGFSTIGKERRFLSKGLPSRAGTPRVSLHPARQVGCRATGSLASTERRHGRPHGASWPGTSVSILNHWWSIAFHLTTRGLTTSAMAADRGMSPDIVFDLPSHEPLCRTINGEIRKIQAPAGSSGVVS